MKKTATLALCFLTSSFIMQASQSPKKSKLKSFQKQQRKHDTQQMLRYLYEQPDKTTVAWETQRNQKLAAGKPLTSKGSVSLQYDNNYFSMFDN